ncbi:fluoride efflux transporter CrcB [Amycolatopsis sp. NPDC088138]|uniref:fluoride efflux transporter CrcB n=1 Tax=Amycolatopsis sp. NPDC088138 TaxID=3363938 RepID=UPI0038131566
MPPENPEPVDPDIADPPPHESRRRLLETVGAVAAGGVLGACARYGATLLWPAVAGGFPWTTFWINVTGCAAMGVLMAVIAAVPAAHPLVRPFLGTGILGGYTTFSTYAVDAQHLLDGGHAGTALLYLAATVAAALAAVWVTAALTRRALRLGSRS